MNSVPSSCNSTLNLIAPQAESCMCFHQSQTSPSLALLETAPERLPSMGVDLVCWHLSIYGPPSSSEKMSVGWCSNSGSFILGNVSPWWLMTETKVNSTQPCNKRWRRRKIMLSFIYCFQNENKTLFKFLQMQTLWDLLSLQLWSPLSFTCRAETTWQPHGGLD